MCGRASTRRGSGRISAIMIGTLDAGLGLKVSAHT